MQSATVRPGLAQQPGTSATDFPQDAAKTAPKQTYKSTQLTLSENSEALPELDNDVRESTFDSLHDTSYANSKTPQGPLFAKPRHANVSDVSSTVNAGGVKVQKSKKSFREAPDTRSPPNISQVSRPPPTYDVALSRETAGPNASPVRISPARSQKSKSEKPTASPQYARPASLSASVTAPPASKEIDEPLPALGGLQLGNAAVAAANKFKEATLYKPPVFTRCSMWTPGTEVVPRTEASGDLNIVKNYVHAPQEPLPRRDTVSREMAMASCVLVSVLLVLAAAGMNMVLGHSTAKASRMGSPDSLSTTSESGDDSVVLWQPEKPQSQQGATNGSRDNAAIGNNTIPQIMRRTAAY
ncbi:hypothetical protein HPB51_007550 [Rhipicephalus microplus]|uniref:Uncharacterized protein n=1 Tax=Rhipicephalus microplus TaxID=6941 RepID=A0A9J6EYH8_RHIMP|nr:hypothetical protein HPB51_007550 [Rhipicephalus microplus]